MTWTKLSDDSTDDPALLALPRSIRLVHFEALVWCNRHGTDGAIPRHMLVRVTDEKNPTKAAKLLVAAGKWKQAEDGWEIVGFLDDQPSAEDVRNQKELARQRQRRQRQHKAGDHTLCNAKYCRGLRDEQGDKHGDETRKSRVTKPVTNVVSHDTPSRPVPTRPGPKEPGTGRGTDDRKTATCKHTWTSDNECVNCGRVESCPNCRRLARINDVIRCHQHQPTQEAS